ncbi:MAG: Dabb family protein [Alphaproteobacteria bacterium]|nr:Dabb family protein [Alphaproteobacteria bacterium]
MFVHIVMMRLEGADEAFHAQVRDYVKRIKKELPYVRAYAYGRNIADRGKGLDWAIYSTFDNSADHDRYQVSPLHQEFKVFMGKKIADICVCDMEA